MRDRVILIALLVAGLLVRLICLDTTPPGLWGDEANHGLEANDIVQGGTLPLFFPGNCGQEPLFKYVIAGLTALVGPGVSTLRLAAALSGWLLLPLTWILSRRMRGTAFALLSLFFLAFGVWHLHFSRIAFRAILGPTLGVLAFLGADSARTHRSALRLLVAGILAGALWYSYPAFRLLTVVPLLWLLPGARRHGGIPRTVVPFAAGFVISLLPLFWAWKGQPELFTARASMAALWTETPDVAQGIIRNTVKHLGMFLFSGDPNWRHNLSRAPQLDVITGFFFLIGLAVAVSRRTRFDALLLIWAALMLVPGVLSVERQAPHCLRTLGVLPVPYLLAAQGVLWLKERSGSGAGRRTFLVALLALVPILTLSRYFIAWPAGLNKLKSTDESLFGFNRQEHALGEWLADREGAGTVWLSPQLFLHPTTAYIAKDADYRLLSSEQVLHEGDLVVLQLAQRNLWWLRDDFRKNFFIWWWDNGRANEEETWAALMWSYPQCGQGMVNGSDQWILSSLIERYILQKRPDVAGLTVREIELPRAPEKHGAVWPSGSWRRLPAGCFSVTIDSLPPGTSAALLVAKEEESPRSWTLDRIDDVGDTPILLQGCVLFPTCARVHCVRDDAEYSLDPSVRWAYSGAPVLEPYFRHTLWGKMRAVWAQLRTRTGL